MQRLAGLDCMISNPLQAFSPSFGLIPGVKVQFNKRTKQEKC